LKGKSETDGVHELERSYVKQSNDVCVVWSFTGGMDATVTEKSKNLRKG
jgi:hypothetical protein